MHVSFALFADAANLSQEGKLNVLGVFDAVHVGQFPALHPRATFVVRIKAATTEAGAYPLSLRWMNPKGVELWSSTAELAINAAPGQQGEMDMPIIVQLDLPLDVPGDYTMHVDLGNHRHASALLHVRGGVAPTVPPAAGQMVS